MDSLIVGCGYLGRRVARLWAASGHRIIATSRTPARIEELRQAGIEPLRCDVLDPPSLRHLPAVATVLYCVGFDLTCGHSRREVYVTGLANVLASLPPPRRFLYVSSTGVYGQSCGEEVDETAATEPVEESGQVVWEAERLLRERLPQAVMLRFAGIYGPGRLSRRRQAILSGEPLLGDPQRWLNLIHVEDGATAVLAAERRARPGKIYNVCDDTPVRRRDFFAELARLLAAPEPCFQPAAGSLLPSRERNNRRVLNRRMRQELGVELRYPSYIEGLPNAVDGSSPA